jgi:AcrR family transcriptional regulator
MTDVVQRPSTRARERTRARLLDAASEVFAEVGVDAASVEAICERAGFSRGAFYSNFGSKDQLLFALTERFAEQKIVKVEQRVRDLEASGEELSPTEVVERLIDVAIDKRVGILLASEIRIRALRDPDLGRMYIAWQDGMVERIAGFVDDLLRIYSLKSRIPVAEMARLVVQTWEDAAVSAVMSGLDAAETTRLVSSRTALLATGLVEPA